MVTDQCIVYCFSYIVFPILASKAQTYIPAQVKAFPIKQSNNSNEKAGRKALTHEDVEGKCKEKCRP